MSQEEKCKTSPNCSHNTNGRDYRKPCSVEFKPQEKKRNNWIYQDKYYHVQIEDGEVFVDGKSERQSLLQKIEEKIKQHTKMLDKLCMHHGDTDCICNTEYRAMIEELTDLKNYLKER